MRVLGETILWRALHTRCYPPDPVITHIHVQLSTYCYPPDHTDTWYIQCTNIGIKMWIRKGGDRNSETIFKNSKDG